MRPGPSANTRFGSLLFAIALVVCPVPLDGSTAVQQLTIRVHLEAATALRVSSPVLVFDVASDGGTAVASIEYTASARAPRDGEVVLSVDAMRSVEGPGGAADADSTLTVGEQDAAVPVSRPVVAQRWIGGGTRSGRLVFTLRAAAAGRYVVPVTLLLTTP